MHLDPEPGNAPGNQGNDAGLPRSVVFKLCSRSSRNPCSCHSLCPTRSLGYRRKTAPSSEHLGAPLTWGVLSLPFYPPPQGTMIDKDEWGGGGRDSVQHKEGGIRGLKPLVLSVDWTG